MSLDQPGATAATSNTGTMGVGLPARTAPQLVPVYALRADGSSEPLVRMVDALERLQQAWVMPAMPARAALLSRLSAGPADLYTGWGKSDEDYWALVAEDSDFGEDAAGKPAYTVTHEGDHKQSRYVAIRRDVITQQWIGETDLHEPWRLGGENAVWRLLRALQGRPRLSGRAGALKLLHLRDVRMWRTFGVSAEALGQYAKEGPVVPGATQVRHGVEFPLPKRKGIRIPDEWRVAVFKLRHIDKLPDEQLATLIGRETQQLSQIIGVLDAPSSKDRCDKHSWMTDEVLRACDIPVPASWVDPVALSKKRA